jgi:hypothetical protein
LLFLFTLWRYSQRPGWGRLVICGLALGLTLVAKFSAIFLLPLGAILIVAATRWQAEPASDSAAEPEKRAGKGGSNEASPRINRKRLRNGRRVEKTVPEAGASLQRRRILASVGAFAAICGIAVIVVEAAYFFPRDPFLYIAGLKKVNADHDPNYLTYFHDSLVPRMYSYFAATYLLKEPLASILLAGAGLVILFRSRSVPALKKLFLLLPPAVFFLAATFFAAAVGIRYIMPVLPFAYLLGGVALAALFRKPAWGRYAAAGLCLWVAVAAAGIYPDHLSYFNEAACLLESPERIGWDGGARCGPAWLDDSNVDWGQGLKQLRQWADRLATGRTVRLAYFGSYPAETYGPQFQAVEPRELFSKPSPGLYAVSAHILARLPALDPTGAPIETTWLRRTEPSDIVGHAYYIYDVRQRNPPR